MYQKLGKLENLKGEMQKIVYNTRDTMLYISKNM